jgi:LPS-assembly lipoprotein
MLRRYRLVFFWGLLVCVLGATTACGWRLKGRERLSPTMSVTYVETDNRYSDFNRALRDILLASGAKLTSNRSEATGVIRILHDESGQRVLSFSPRNTPQEYEVFYAVEYSVANGGGEVIPAQKLELTRDYRYEETAVLAKQREQTLLRESLARDLAGLVVRRLASL